MGEASASQESRDPEAPLSTHDLFQRLYAELRRLAALRMAGERSGDTLQPTALVNEVWLRLSTLRQQTWRDEDHFIAAASETMRRILVDRARHRRSAKNGGELRRTRLELDDLPGSQAAQTPTHPKRSSLSDGHWLG